MFCIIKKDDDRKMIGYLTDKKDFVDFVVESYIKLLPITEEELKTAINYEAGVYLLKIRTPEGVIQKKMILE